MISEFSLRNVKSPWNGEYYIGFVLDAVTKCLGLEVEDYELVCRGSLYDTLAGHIKFNGGKIYVSRVVAVEDGCEKILENKYVISGVPNNTDFSLLDRSVQRVWDRDYEKMCFDRDRKMKKIESSKDDYTV